MSRTLPTSLVAMAVLKDMLAEADAHVRAELTKQMLPTDRQTAVVYVDDEAVPVGSVTRKKMDPGGQVTAAVTDIDALVHWCTTHAPDEIEVIVTVRSAFQKRLLDVVKAQGGWPDPMTGEVIAVDGLTLDKTGPSGGGLVVNKTADGPDLIRAEIAAGRLTFADVLALPAGTQ